MPTATLCGRLEDPAMKECREALVKNGFEVVLRPYYGSQYSVHEFPIVTHNLRSYRGTKELYAFLAQHSARQAQKPETKVISSIHKL